MVDLLVYVAVGILSLVVIAVVFFVRNIRSKSDINNEEPVRNVQDVVIGARARNDGPPGAAARRRRIFRHGAQPNGEDSDTGEENQIEIDLPSDGKVGAKKLRKLEEKATKKAQREALEQDRKEKKIREEKLEKQRKKDEAKIKAEEEAKAVEEQKLKEEREKQEYEEYLKLKETFTVDEQGEQAEDEQDQQSLLKEFISYIQNMKVVVLEDLAAHFKIKTQDAIDRIKTLQEEGRLSGVIDDRGKFIYITKEEYEAVAKFIKQRGRVSISELAESMNRLINLNPESIPIDLPSDVMVAS